MRPAPAAHWAPAAIQSGAASVAAHVVVAGSDTGGGEAAAHNRLAGRGAWPHRAGGLVVPRDGGLILRPTNQQMNDPCVGEVNASSGANRQSSGSCAYLISVIQHGNPGQ